MQKFIKVYGPSTFTRGGFIKHGALTAATLLAAPYLLRSHSQFEPCSL